MTTVPIAVKLQCFHCDNDQRRTLDSLNFGNLLDYRCPRCGRCGTTHVVKVETEEQQQHRLRGLLNRS